MRQMKTFPCRFVWERAAKMIMPTMMTLTTTTQRNTEAAAAAASAVNVAVARTTIAELTCPHQEKILEWIIVSSDWGLSVLYKE